MENTKTIFIPYYDRGYHVIEVPAERARKVGKYWHCNGWCYGEHAFTTDPGAWAWIDKQYTLSRSFEYQPA